MSDFDNWSKCKPGSTGRSCARVWSLLKGQLQFVDVGKELKNFVKWVRKMQDSGRLTQDDEPLPSVDHFKLELQFMMKKKDTAVKSWEAAGKPRIGIRKSDKLRSENECASAFKYVPKILMIVYGVAICVTPDGALGCSDKLVQGGIPQMVQKSDVTPKDKPDTEVRLDHLECKGASPSSPPPYSTTKSPYGQCTQMLNNMMRAEAPAKDVLIQAPLVQVKSGLLDFDQLKDDDGQLKVWFQTNTKHLSDNNTSDPSLTNGNHEHLGDDTSAVTLMTHSTPLITPPGGSDPSRHATINQYAMDKGFVTLDHVSCFDESLQTQQTRSSLFPQAKGQPKTTVGNVHQLRGNKQHGGMFPLVSAGRGNLQYNPFGFKDLTVIAQELPDLQKGAIPYIRCFLTNTTGIPLALGDFRAILTKSTSSGALLEIENEADTVELPDDTSLQTCVAEIWEAMRTLYPLDVSAMGLTSMPHQPKESGKSYLRRCLDNWQDSCGMEVEKSSVLKDLFRAAVYTSMTTEVKSQLDSVVGLSTKTWADWSATIAHYLDLVNKKQDDANQEVRDLQKQLLKAQLKQVRDMELTTKAAAKASTQAPVMQVDSPTSFMAPVQAYQSWPPQPPQPPQPTQPPRPPPSFTRNAGRGRGRFRAGTDVVCFVCGKPGHLARNCRTGGRNRAGRMQEFPGQSFPQYPPAPQPQMPRPVPQPTPPYPVAQVQWQAPPPAQQQTGNSFWTAPHSHNMPQQ